MKHKRNWIIGIVLSTTAAFAALQTVNAPSQNESATDTPIAIIITETSAPPSGNCYFTWATKDAPELTKKLDGAVKKLNPDASATVTLFGEDCTYGDGSSTFGVMQTDFKIRLPIEDLTKHEDFGNWISQTMSIITQIPREEIQGNWGFVEFWFKKSESENIILRVPIQKYADEAKEKTGEELFNMFYQQ